MRKSLRPLLAVAVVGCAALGLSSPALAGTPTGDYAPFKYCPYANPAVTSCINSTVTSGSFKLGNATVPITAATPITLQGGVIDDYSGNATPWVNAVGADTLSKTRLKVPGGLLGLVDTGGFGGALITLFNNAVAAENDVYATAELAGPIQFSTANFLNGFGTTATLPLRIHLENPFLGSSCYIGSSSRPVTLNLTDGTTAPPPPNKPISGTSGYLTQNDAFDVVTMTGDRLVDNAFSVPAASNCGFLLLDKLLITAAVNLKEGLPAAAGKNTAIMGGDTKIGLGSSVRTSAGL
jgi:hypothetical protein